MRSPSETFATLPRRGMLSKLAELSSPSPSPRATSAQLLELYRCTRARRSLSPEGFSGLTKKGMRQRLDELGIEAKGSRTRLAEAYSEWYRARDGDGAGDAAELDARSSSAPPPADLVTSSEAPPAELAEPEVEAAAPEAPPVSEDTKRDAKAAPATEDSRREASEPAAVAREATSREVEASTPPRSEPQKTARTAAPPVEAGRVSIVPVVRVAGSAAPASEDEDDIVLSVESLPPEERAELEALFDLDDEPEVAFDTLPPEAREQVMRAVEESSDAAFEIPSVRLRAPAVPALEEASPAATSTPPSAATEPQAEASVSASLPAEAPARKKKKKKKKKKKGKRPAESAAVDEPVFVEAAVTPAERRVGDRVPLEVDIGYLSDTNFYQGFSEDLSEGGLFVATVHILPMGQAVELSFVLPGGAEVVAEGRVAWVRQGRSYDSQTQAGMGVAFEKVDSAGEAAIRQYMSVRDPIFYVD